MTAGYRAAACSTIAVTASEVAAAGGAASDVILFAGRRAPAHRQRSTPATRMR
jgi:hypothetical protein